MTSDTTSQHFFEAKYRRDKDPWRFASSSYELSRYDAIVRALDERRYRHAFEPGCSVGVLTERLAPLSDRLTATDISPTAVELARERCAQFLHVDIRCESISDSVYLHSSRAGEIDLLVLSEIGYYFNRSRWRALAACLVASVAPSGTILAAHWLGHSDDHLQGGNSVHDLLRSIDSISLEYAERNDGFRLDRWRRQ